MNNYKRIISYIYMYKNSNGENLTKEYLSEIQRVRNVGFAKIDGRQNNYKITVSLKTPKEYPEEQLFVNLLIRTERGYEGIGIGSFKPIQNNCEFKTLVDRDDIADTGIGFDRVCGIYITSKSGGVSGKDKYYFLCQWADEDFELYEYRPYGKVTKEELLKTIETYAVSKRRCPYEQRRKIHERSAQTG